MERITLGNDVTLKANSAVDYDKVITSKKYHHYIKRATAFATAIILLSLLAFNQGPSLSSIAYGEPTDRRTVDAPMSIPFGAGIDSTTKAAAADTCQKLPISSIAAIGSQSANPPSNAIDNNLNTRWSNFGVGSWIQTDFGGQRTICSVDIAWYNGNQRQYNFVISVSNDGTVFSSVFTGKSSGTTLSPERYNLPVARFVRITVNGNTQNNWASITELAVNGFGSINPPPSSNLYDNFEGGTYRLADGQISPNGKWVDNFNGYGAAGVQDDGTGTNKVFFMYPQTATSPSESSSSSVSSTQKFSNFELSIDAKTVKQLRQNSPPNPWEAATIFFRESDTFHFYAFVLKTNGIEFDKKDCNTCTDPVEGQQFLVTLSSPTLKIGSWSNWKVTAIGNHITITVDGNKVIDYIDQTMSPQLSDGAVVMYNEDAYAEFDNVYITPK